MRTLWNHDIQCPEFVREFDCGHRSEPVASLALLPGYCKEQSCSPFYLNMECPACGALWHGHYVDDKDCPACGVCGTKESHAENDEELTTRP